MAFDLHNMPTTLKTKSLLFFIGPEFSFCSFPFVRHLLFKLLSHLSGSFSAIFGVPRLKTVQAKCILHLHYLTLIYFGTTPAFHVFTVIQ